MVHLGIPDGIGHLFDMNGCGRVAKRQPMTVELVARTSKEDHFRAVYERTFPAILNYVRRRLPLGERSELDVTSEIYAVVWRRLDDLPAPPEDLLWIYGVARHSVARFHRDHSRRRRIRARVEAEPFAQTDTGGTDEINEHVRSAVARLGATDREAIRLAHWEGLHHDEIATILGLTPNAVELRLRRARARLRRDLTELLEVEQEAGPLRRDHPSLPREGNESDVT
jgi:RNA polymerase sigma factor (sigma-70 family)